MSDTKRPWAAANLTPAERAEAYAHQVWINRMACVFQLADAPKRYQEIKDECLEALEAAISQALAAAAPRWVKVAEQLPNPQKTLWVCDEDDNVELAYFSGNYQKFLSEEYDEDIDGVIWWQYVAVPEPPQAAGGENQDAPTR